MQLAQMADDPQALAQRVGELYPQLSERKRGLLARQSAWLFAMPAFADRLQERVARLSAGAQGPDLRAHAGALGALLMARGVARLPSDDQARFVSRTAAFLRQVDAATCRAALEGTLPPDRVSTLEMGFNAVRDDIEFENDLALHRRALGAELQASTPLPRLATQQEDAAEAAMQRAFYERRRSPQSRAAFERFDRAAPGEESDADACWFGLQYLDVMLTDLRGEARSWQLQRYLNALAGE